MIFSRFIKDPQAIIDHPFYKAFIIWCKKQTALADKKALPHLKLLSWQCGGYYVGTGNRYKRSIGYTIEQWMATTDYQLHITKHTRLL